MVLQERRFYQYFDWLLVLAPLVLVALGTVMIYNTTGTTEGLDTSDLWHDITFRQMLFAAVGFFALFSLSVFDFRVFGTLRYPIYLLVIGLLGVVLIIGQIQHGAQRWIEIGGFQLQPSEPAKLLLVLVLGRFLANHEDEINKWRTLAVSLVIVGVPAVMIYLQPDLGTALVIGFIWFVMIMATGLSWKRVLLLVALGIVLLPLVWLTLQPYQQERFMTFLDPKADPLGAGYNVLQAQIAIGSGGFWGLGLGAGSQGQLRFLRIRHTDFIFSVIGEELGFWGGVFFFLLFMFIILRLLRAALRTHSTFGRLVIIGFSAGLFFQTFVNLGMNLGLMPVTGIPLPFVSSGGSSLVTFLMMLGIVESILSHDRAIALRGEPKGQKKQVPFPDYGYEYGEYA
ncbi:MAG: rod shape-determining protein RodA [Rudaea sp.]